MGGTDTVFAGSIPAMYEQYMVPLLFRPYAELAAQRARAFHPSRVLETAAGTGVATEALRAAMPEAAIVATDLNQPMIDEASRRLISPKIRFQQADALALPFPDASFELVVCQFGAMFFPEKVQGHSEARRVLGEGGRYLLLIWDSIDKNVATHVAGNAVAELFPENAESFYLRIPFRYFDRQLIESDLRAAGFAEVQIETVELTSRAPSARDAAIGLTQGTPMRTEIEKGGPDMLARATDAATRALERFEGPNGFEAPMSAHIATATR